MSEIANRIIAISSALIALYILSGVIGFNKLERYTAILYKLGLIEDASSVQCSTEVEVSAETYNIEYKRGFNFKSRLAMGCQQK